MTSDQKQPDVQLISNLVVIRGDGRILFVRDPDDDRWWLPGEDLRPYQHPDERAEEVLDEVGGLTCRLLRMVFVESFRGRRGWHVVFHYRAEVEGDASDPGAEWFAPDELPRTAHGAWERKAVERVLGDSVATEGSSVV
jgi:ADP-ribose pyrophosphatase YjhB (NUDIX family)